MDVGEMEKQRWNGCPTGDRRVKGNLVEMDRDGTGQGRDEDEGECRVTDAEEV